MNNYFICPLCKDDLISDLDGYVCNNCRKRWRFYDGVPDFSVRTGYWGEFPEEKMEKFINLCEEIGWMKALANFFAHDRDYYEYILDRNRANFHFLLSLDENSCILDAGAGWGTISFSLARFYKRVFAFDIVKQRVKFIDMQRRDLGVNNLIPAIGHTNHLPFRDNYFDLVILNGVLEWIPYLDKKKNPYIQQLTALKELRRVLKKGGKIYIGIENRWAFINFLGFKDTHSGLRFAPVLPRVIADIYSKIVKGEPFVEYTYTIFELKKILKKAGFKGIEFYAPLPTYRRFQWIIPVEIPGNVKFFVKRLVEPRTVLQEIVINIVKFFALYRLAKYFVPDFSAIAEK